MGEGERLSEGVKVVTVYTMTIIVYTVIFEKLDKGSANGWKEVFCIVQRSEKKFVND